MSDSDPSQAQPDDSLGKSAHDRSDPEIHACLTRYWRANITAMLVLLTVWASAGLVCGILIADWLNQFSIGGAPLGFWFAQQGSILVFVVLIFVYAFFMNWLDKKHHDELEALRKSKSQNTSAGG